MSIKEEYEKKQQAQLNEWAAQIKKLKAKADMAEAEAQLNYYKQIKELQAMQDDASDKLTKLKNAGGEAWEDLKAGMESRRGSLSNAMKAAASRFK